MLLGLYLAKLHIEMTTEFTPSRFSILPIGKTLHNHAEQIIIPQAQFCTILWVSIGSGTCLTDARSHPIENGTVYAFTRGELKKIIATEISTGFLLTISPDLLYVGEAGFNLSLFTRGHGIPGDPLIVRMDEDTIHDTEEVLKQINKKSSIGAAMQEELVKQLFKIFLLYLVRKIPVDDKSYKWARDYQLVKDFLHMLHHSAGEKRMVCDYAGKMNITPGYLNQIVKRVSGFTASHHIQQQVVEEAKKRVTATGCSMKEVAYSLGFDDLAHFSKFFKTNSGTNFTTFRKGIAG